MLHTVKPSCPKSSFSVIAAAMPAGLPRRTQNDESMTITDKVTGYRPVKNNVVVQSDLIPLLGK